MPSTGRPNISIEANGDEPRRPGRRPQATANRNWYRISNQYDGPALVDIYDEIGYWGVTAADFVHELRGIDAQAIELHINSPGGDVYDGIAIYNALIDHPAAVEVHVDALAASAASFIAQAGDKIVMNRASEMMIHDPWGLTVGNAEDHRQMAEDLDRIGDSIAGIYNERAGGGVKTWRSRMRDETWYTAEEAVSAGLADEVHSGRRTENSWDLSVFAYAGRSKAPAPDIGEPVKPRQRPAPVDIVESPADPKAEEPDPPEAPAEEVPEEQPEPIAFDGIDEADGFDPKSLHTALLDAADESLDVDTTRLRAALEDDFDYTPDAFRSALLDLVNQAPAPPPVDLPEPLAPRTIDIDDFTAAAKEALSS